MQLFNILGLENIIYPIGHFAYAVALFGFNRLSVTYNINCQHIVFAFEIINLFCKHSMIDKGSVNEKHPLVTVSAADVIHNGRIFRY